MSTQFVSRNDWPPALSDGLSLRCSDCGSLPKFDYRVMEEFWRRWAGDDRLGVICLPCPDRRSGGVGLAEALIEVQWTGTAHTVVLNPERRYEYDHAAEGLTRSRLQRMSAGYFG